METLQAEVREARGKGPARQLRMQGKIPAVLYGLGEKPMCLSVDPKALTGVLSTPHRRNVLISVDVQGTSSLAMLKEVQVHPLTREVRHLDLYRVAADKPVKVDIPLKTKGRAKGVASGGKMRVFFRTVPVLTKASEIPAVVLVDVGPLDQHESVTAKQLPVPEGVQVLLPPDQDCVLIEGEKRREPTEDAEATADKKKKK